jgi:hypothetical protein
LQPLLEVNMNETQTTKAEVLAELVKWNSHQTKKNGNYQVKHLVTIYWRKWSRLIETIEVLEVNWSSTSQMRNWDAIGELI